MELSLWKINSIIIIFVSTVKNKECPMKDKTCLSGDNLIEMKKTDGLVACSKYITTHLMLQFICLFGSDRSSRSLKESQFNVRPSVRSSGSSLSRALNLHISGS